MDTNKSKLSKAGRYLRELSVVVIGVAITLALTNYLSTRSEKRDTALYLNAVKLELEVARIYIDSTWIPAMEEAQDYVRYISLNDISTLHPDTVKLYDLVYYQLLTINHLYPAFEMLKNSGNMRFITDRELQQSIWSVYIDIGFVTDYMERYNQEKRDKIREEWQLHAEGRHVPVPMYRFFYSPEYPGSFESSLLRNLKGIANEIKETVAMIEKEIN